MTSQRPAANVKFSDLLDAFEFVSAGSPFEHNAYIDPDTGIIYWTSDNCDLEDEIPDDLESSDRYIAVPHKNDLNLGRDLVWSFVDAELPDDYNTVTNFFHRKGAYGRFKDFLQARGLLEKWYAFEASATENGLRSWCGENSIELVNEQTPD